VTTDFSRTTERLLARTECATVEQWWWWSQALGLKLYRARPNPPPIPITPKFKPKLFFKKKKKFCHRVSVYIDIYLLAE